MVLWVIEFLQIAPLSFAHRFISTPFTWAQAMIVTSTHYTILTFTWIEPAQSRPKTEVKNELLLWERACPLLGGYSFLGGSFIGRFQRMDVNVYPPLDVLTLVSCGNQSDELGGTFEFERGAWQGPAVASHRPLNGELLPGRRRATC